jgi:hypothetical protein
MENSPITENPSAPDALPDGIVAFVKRDCPTCELVAPLLVEIAGRGLVAAIVTQDDPTFPDGGDALGDRFEAMWDRGWSDGLPLVPPTEARVAADARRHHPPARRGRHVVPPTSSSAPSRRWRSTR